MRSVSPRSAHACSSRTFTMRMLTQASYIYDETRPDSYLGSRGIKRLVYRVVDTAEGSDMKCQIRISCGHLCVRCRLAPRTRAATKPDRERECVCERESGQE